MLNFLPSEDDSTMVVEFDGKAAKQDAQYIDEYVKMKFGQKEKFNILAILHDVDGTTLKGMTEGLKVDAKHWQQFRKFAIISDKNWLQIAGWTGKYLPGIDAKHFYKNQQEEAWDWLKS